jgi:hypothetical protein
MIFVDKNPSCCSLVNAENAVAKLLRSLVNDNYVVYGWSIWSECWPISFGWFSGIKERRS